MIRGANLKDPSSQSNKKNVSNKINNVVLDYKPKYKIITHDSI